MASLTISIDGCMNSNGDEFLRKNLQADCVKLAEKYGLEVGSFGASKSPDGKQCSASAYTPPGPENESHAPSDADPDCGTGVYQAPAEPEIGLHAPLSFVVCIRAGDRRGLNLFTTPKILGDLYREVSRAAHHFPDDGTKDLYEQLSRITDEQLSRIADDQLSYLLYHQD